jgi:leucyl-tRNA synthetase
MEKMSKSKKNVVGLEAVVEMYGADTARLLLLSDSPPERDLEWSAAGIEGAWRYINRLWRLIDEALPAMPAAGAAVPGDLGEAATALRRATHKTVKNVTSDFDGFHFNKAVARLRELTNDMADADAAAPGMGFARREAAEAITRLIAPVTPHLAEELWRKLGHEGFVLDAPWPKAEAALTVDDLIKVAIQVNGKLRATIDLPRDAAKEDAEAAALAEENVRRAIGEAKVRKIIVVPNRIVNVVI